MGQQKLNNPYLSKSKYNNISYIGKVYGNLKIVDFVIDKDGHFAFKCMCLCQEGEKNPKYDIVLPSKLINGVRISCGCKANNVQYNDKKYIGQTFGALTVLEILENNKAGDGVQFRCRCKHCGDENVIVGARHAIYGRQKTCDKVLCRKLENLTSTKYRNSNYIGMVYGKLKVVEIVPPNVENNVVIWVCKCLNDGNLVLAPANDIVAGEITSCGCLQSKGEFIIKEILRCENVEFKQQYYFKDLVGVGKGYLRYDFAIFENDNLKCLLEFDGPQHRLISFVFGQTQQEKDEKFKTIQYHDNLKNIYAMEHNIPLYRFYIPNAIKNKDKVEQYLKDFGII